MQVNLHFWHDNRASARADALLFPNNARFAHESYLNATREPFGYLLVDCHPNQIDDDLRLRTKIFPDDNRHFVYVPKK